MTSHAIDDYRNRNEDAPLHLVRETWSARHSPDRWLGQGENWLECLGIRPRNSMISPGLTAFAFLLHCANGGAWPAAIRSWKSGLLPGNSSCLAPHYRWLVKCRDFLMIAVDDVQTGSGNGIHVDFLSEPDPEVHGINGITDADEFPDLPWYKDKYIATGLRVPTLIFTTLLYHLFQPSPLVRDDAVYLKVRRRSAAAWRAEAG